MTTMTMTTYVFADDHSSGAKRRVVCALVLVHAPVTIPGTKHARFAAMKQEGKSE